MKRESAVHSGETSPSAPAEALLLDHGRGGRSDLKRDERQP